MGVCRCSRPVDKVEIGENVCAAACRCPGMKRHEQDEGEATFTHIQNTHTHTHRHTRSLTDALKRMHHHSHHTQFLHALFFHRLLIRANPDAGNSFEDFCACAKANLARYLNEFFSSPVLHLCPAKRLVPSISHGPRFMIPRS